MNSEEIKGVIKEALREVLAELRLSEISITGKEEAQYVNAVQAAAILKRKVSTVYWMVRHRLIPYYKQGARLSFRREDLLQYMASSRCSSQAELTELTEKNAAKEISTYK